MGVHNFTDLNRHYGHNIYVARYGQTNTHNVAIECEECDEVLLDFDLEHDEVS